MPLTRATSTALDIFTPLEPVPERQQTEEWKTLFYQRNFLRRTITDGTMAERVRAFRILNQLSLPRSFRSLSIEERALHRRLLNEELSEFHTACNEDNNIEQVDALLDLIYVALGALLNYGLTPTQIDILFGEVHASNMTKADDQGRALFDDGGKVLKGPHYVRPDIAGLIETFPGAAASDKTA